MNFELNNENKYSRVDT